MRRIGTALTELTERAAAPTPTLDPDLRLPLERALATLTADQRQVVDLIYLTGLTFSEAAHALRIPVGTVMSRVSAALAQIRGFLTE